MISPHDSSDPPPVVVTFVITAIAVTWHTDARGRRQRHADDPAIWVHPKDAASSRVLATLKEGGLDV